METEHLPRFLQHQFEINPRLRRVSDGRGFVVRAGGTRMGEGYLNFSSSASVHNGLSSSKSSSKSKNASSVNSLISRPSFLVGRPSPFCRLTNPPIFTISSSSYWSCEVMFLR